MKNVIKNYISYKYEISSFFQHFERLLEDHHYEESKANFKATQSTLSLSLPIEILKHEATVYTPGIFRMFEKELGKAYDCGINIHNEIEIVTDYRITPHRKHFVHTVKYDSSNGMM